MSDVFLGRYDFAGDTADLVEAYDRMLAAFPLDAMDIHLCVRTGSGLTVYDACPSRDEFRSFSASAEFAAAVAAAGLPAPAITEIGEVHKSIASMSVIGD